MKVNKDKKEEEKKKKTKKSEGKPKDVGRHGLPAASEIRQRLARYTL